MSLSALSAAVSRPGVRMVSTDIFDTVLLRDHSTETDRLATAAALAAREHHVDPEMLVRLRWWLQEDAYRAVALTRPHGEARLSDIWRVAAQAVGLDDAAAEAMHRIEVGVDIEHLSPNVDLLELLGRAADDGLRVVAVSDTFYTGADVARMLREVVGHHPIAAIHTSADLGLTKHHGRLYDAVATIEGVPPACIVHVGDNHEVDVVRCAAASWVPVHLPREQQPARRAAARSLAVGNRLRRSR